MFSALSHRARRQILMTLHFRGGAMTAGAIAQRFEHAWPTTTRHLKVLEEAGLVSCERQAQARLYRIDRKRLKVITDWVAWFDKGPRGG